MSYSLESEQGTITVTDAALSQLVVQAAEDVEGARVRRPRRHLEIEIDDEQARVQLELVVPYGAVLPELARAVQERVGTALEAMCAVGVSAVDVLVEEVA